MDGPRSLVDRGWLAEVRASFPHADHVVAYGSGVVPQAGTGAPGSPDFLVLCDDAPGDADALVRFHEANQARFPRHYAGWARLLGPRAAAAAQRLLPGAQLYFFPEAAVAGRAVKYGVVRTADALRDLRAWTTLYVAGRLQKPVVLLDAPSLELADAMLANRRAAARLAAALLPPGLAPLADAALFERLAALSYAGDVRMGVAEHPDKARGLVAGALDDYRAAYDPLLREESLLEPAGPGRWRRVDASDAELEACLLADDMPAAFCLRMRAALAGGVKTPAAAAESALRSTVRASSSAQAALNLLTSGLGKSARYVLRKVSKRFR